MVIVPSVVLGTMVHAVTSALSEFRRTGVHPSAQGDLSPRDVFALFGAARWDSLRIQFDRDAAAPEEAASI